ncbi:5'-methylthioadenosine/adenosylhomocysteine nucleosidase [Thermoanaerobacterium sp. DL9XJH110]|uniref:5'-methylthioadenosine/adenosylhomocysteine nucleosidase n=1 Tax=Thermoanaerobacterium sp. DL9XJH110 TaxID=3386643 RepID=UPI003BB729D3
MAIIGIIGAMEKEVKFFIENMKGAEIITRASMVFYEGNLHGKRVAVVKSGVGKVNAAACTQILIDFYNPRAVICTGVAGALREDLDFGDVVISKDVVQYDVDATCFGHEPGEIPNLGIKYFEASGELIEIAKKVHDNAFKDKKAVIGRVLTGDQFLSSGERAAFLRNTFEGSCVEMEGGAVGQVCYLNNVPFLIIRSISDRADGRAVADYERFVEETAKRSFELVAGIIKIYGEGNNK